MFFNKKGDNSTRDPLNQFIPLSLYLLLKQCSFVCQMHIVSFRDWKSDNEFIYQCYEFGDQLLICLKYHTNKVSAVDYLKRASYCLS